MLSYLSRSGVRVVFRIGRQPGGVFSRTTVFDIAFFGIASPGFDEIAPVSSAGLAIGIVRARRISKIDGDDCDGFPRAEHLSRQNLREPWVQLSSGETPGRNALIESGCVHKELANFAQIPLAICSIRFVLPR